MRAQLRSELYKLRSTRVFPGVLAAMTALISLAVLLHALGLSVDRLTSQTDQLGIFIDVGTNLGAVFAALLGALAITAEIRSGTIRPTLLITPRRDRVLAAKAATMAVAGFLVGVIATGVAAGVGSAGLAGRGLAVRVTAGQYAQLIAGGGAAAALWAVVGLGIGAVVRAQVPSVVVLLAWLLFVENILTDLPKVARFAPGALARSLAGAQRDATLHTPAAAAVLLVLYAVAAIAVGGAATMRRDVA